MALIKCADCGKEISSLATACPNCGCPLTGKDPVDTDALIKIFLPGYKVDVILAAEDGTELWRGHDGDVAKIPVSGTQTLVVKGLPIESTVDVAESGRYELIRNPLVRHGVVVKDAEGELTADKKPDVMKKTKSDWKTVFWIIVAIISIALICGAVAKNSKDFESLKYVSTSKKSDGVTLENFNKVNSSMTYSDVCKLFGKTGELMSEVDMLGTVTKSYVWYDETGICNCVITFQDGKEVSKAQAGLK